MKKNKLIHKIRKHFNCFWDNKQNRWIITDKNNYLYGYAETTHAAISMLIYNNKVNINLALTDNWRCKINQQHRDTKGNVIWGKSYIYKNKNLKYYPIDIYQHESMLSPSFDKAIVDFDKITIPMVKNFATSFKESNYENAVSVVNETIKQRLINKQKYVWDELNQHWIINDDTKIYVSNPQMVDYLPTATTYRGYALTLDELQQIVNDNINHIKYLSVLEIRSKANNGWEYVTPAKHNPISKNDFNNIKNIIRLALQDEGNIQGTDYIYLEFNNDTKINDKFLFQIFAYQ